MPMFETENVETYLQDAWPDVDGEKRLIKLRCYVNPVSRDLCSEVDEEIARTLFHLVGKEWLPRPLLQSCKFITGAQPYALNFCRDPKFGNHHVHIPAVTISKLEAGKVTPESSDFALMFTVAFEKNDPKILNDLADLLHEKFYLTFKELQPSLFGDQDPVMDLLCRMCDAPNPEFATIDGKFAYCAKHDKNIQEGESLRRIRDHAAAAELAREPGDESETEAPRKDPLADEAAFINKRNRRNKK